MANSFALVHFLMILRLISTNKTEQATCRFSSKVLSQKNDINRANTLFETNDYASVIDKPVLANGHIGYVPFSDSIYMNGLYNGHKDNSHRARIPNYANIYFEPCNGQKSINNSVLCNYGLDIERGIFRTQANFITNGFKIEQVQYAHRYYDTMIVNQVVIRRIKSDHNESIKLKVSRKIGTKSEDLKIHTIRRKQLEIRRVFLVNATTTIPEDSRLQRNLSNVYILYESIPPEIELPANCAYKKFVWITIIDSKDISDLDLFEKVHMKRNRLLTIHTAEWKKFWNENNVIVEGNDRLSKSVQAGLYAIVSSLPSLNKFRPHTSFFGLSPSGLGLGGPKLEGYQGHNFWDTEIWMHPTILLLEPRWSEQLLYYRYILRSTARENAQNSSYEGLRFPWESGYTGIDVTLKEYPDIIKYQQHITADIGHAVRKHFSATYDQTWLLNVGCELAFGISEFWASRLTFDVNKHRYVINGVMGPDEDHSNVDNDAFTNVGAALSLHFGDYASCICNKSGFVKELKKTNWSSMASHLYLPYDSQNDYNPQYDGYTLNTTIKQADVVLLGYPLMYANIQRSTRLNNINLYGNRTRANGPAMTWSMHAIAHLDIGENPDSDLFNKTHIPYIREPFYVWNEYVNGVPDGASNFITGAGGFLQLILYGYSGIRLNLDRLSIENPTLPPHANKLKLNGIAYMQARFSLEIEENVYCIRIKTNRKQIRLFVDGVEENSKKAIWVLNRVQKIVMKPRERVINLFESCPFPKDDINQLMV